MRASRRPGFAAHAGVLLGAALIASALGYEVLARGFGGTSAGIAVAPVAACVAAAWIVFATASTALWLARVRPVIAYGASTLLAVALLAVAAGYVWCNQPP